LKDLWNEKYRPSIIDDYVFQNQDQREKVESWLKQGSIPHLLFSGSPGVGKTTLAKVLINELGVNNFDVMIANGSKEGRKIEWVDKLISFCKTIPFGDFKIVLIDEADYLNPHSVQPALRNLMEEYSETVRFILTCNLPNRLIDAIHSRTVGFHIEKIDKNDFTARIATILIEENIDVDLDTLDTYVKATYPDLRKCINLLQMNSTSGSLKAPDEFDKNQPDWRTSVVQLFKQRKISEARKLICKSATPDELGEIYSWLYNNLELISDKEEIQDEAILIIKQGLVDHTIIADPEINLSATFIRISKLMIG
jgi:DNA polymerase III delta prime subunit